MKEKLLGLSGWEISQAVKKGEVTQEDVFSFFSGRIQALNPSLRCFVEAYEQPSKGEGNSPLRGVPIAVKDNICIRQKKISCASRILNSHVAVYDATVIDRLKQSGLPIIGVTNMDEFAFGSSTENSCYGPTKNPWDIRRVPGGSSGGSAACVAARLAPCALGSDTGGSIRQPASFCGVVGFKPTYGRVSRYGLVAFGSSLDQIGPLTTNFVDCAHLLNIICGVDEYDATTSKRDVPDFTKILGSKIKGIRLGIPKEYYGEGLDREVEGAIRETISILEKQGIKTVEISLPHTDYAVATYYIIAPSEASSNLQRFDGIKYGLRESASGLMQLYKTTRQSGFGQEAKRRIFLGTYSLSSGYYEAYYLKALKVRTLIKNDFDDAFRNVDAILTPTSPVTAFKLGEKTQDPLSMYLADVYTISANLAGVCAVSFPCGFTKMGLPIGAQLIGKWFDEETLIKIGYQFQEKTTYHKEIPSFKLQ